MNSKIEKCIKELRDNMIPNISKDHLITLLYNNGIIHENISILIYRNGFIKEYVYDDFVNETFLNICKVSEDKLISLYYKDILELINFVMRIALRQFYIDKTRKPNKLGEMIYFSKMNKRNNKRDDYDNF